MSIILDLKAALEADNASWRVNDHLLNITEPLKYRLGGLSDKFVPAERIRPLDFKALLAERTSNPFVLQRRVAQNILSAAAIRPELLMGSMRGMAPLEGAAPSGWLHAFEHRLAQPVGLAMDHEHTRSKWL